MLVGNRAKPQAKLRRIYARCPLNLEAVRVYQDQTSIKRCVMVFAENHAVPRIVRALVGDPSDVGCIKKLPNTQAAESAFPAHQLPDHEGKPGISLQARARPPELFPVCLQSELAGCRSDATWSPVTK